VVLAVEVDTDKIKADADAAKKSVEKVSESVKEKIQDLTGHETAQGKIMEVDEAANRVTLVTKEGKNLTLHLSPSSELKLKTKDAKVKDLKAGDEVTVVYKVEDGKNQVRSITADQAS
jgi:Cu/Ag efflux protein CusF